ncbi:AzlC family ABC transporter permease [Pseudonocardia nematodicida]|uniref:AzlC family ABC transporter permease n=1 Tax=Pseudonocardia nematodicida TaxID=1206997 RepID=A0ABV1K662_9PSEU
MRSVQRTRRAETRADLRDAVTISVAVGVVGVSFGALAPTAGLSPAMTIAMSVLLFAGGAQLLVTGVLAAGGGIWAAVAAALLVNLRHLPYGFALARHLPRGWRRVPAAHVVTDEMAAFVLARTDGEPGRAWRAFRILGVLKYGCWQAGTVAGLLLGAVVPDPSAFGLDAAFPAVLLALLVPTLRAADARRVGTGAAAVSLTCAPFLPAGIPVLAGMAGLALAGRSRTSAGTAEGRTPAVAGYTAASERVEAVGERNPPAADDAAAPGRAEEPDGHDRSRCGADAGEGSASDGGAR